MAEMMTGNAMEKKYIVKEEDDYASKGVAGSALGLGIAGTALGLLNNPNGILGGLFNGANNNRQGCGVTCQDRMADLKEYHSEMFSNYKFTRDGFDAIVAKHNADTFALYQGYTNQTLALQKELDDIKTKLAVTEAIKPYEQKLMYDAIALESERRCCNDNKIVNYLNSNFYPISVADITTATTTTQRLLSNPLCGCCM